MLTLIFLLGVIGTGVWDAPRAEASLGVAENISRRDATSGSGCGVSRCAAETPFFYSVLTYSSSETK